ncbi:MAG TPA: PAS domain S-box protein [Terriglobales bacterium]|nr:PAS domain S-box protein [Terriglobales bacterium]
MRKSLLARTDQVFLAGFPLDQTLGALAESLVPEFADWCFLYTCQPSGECTLAAAYPRASDDPLHAADFFHSDFIKQVTSGDHPVVLSDGISELLMAVTRSQSQASQLLSLGIQSMLIAPMKAFGNTVGAIVFFSSKADKIYGEHDIEFAGDLANRAAAFVENARLQHAAKEALRDKDDALTLLHNVLQQLPAGVIIADPTGKIILRNDYANKFWRTDAPVAQDVDQYPDMYRAFHEDGTPFTATDWPLIKALRSREQVNGHEFEVVRHNGQKVTVRANAAPILDASGKLVAAAVAFEDVTSRVAAERALNASEQRFRSLADATPSAIFIHDNQSFIYANNATSEITGFSNEELMRKNLLDLVHPDSLEYIRERFRLRAEGKPIPSRFEARIVTKDGTAKWIYFSGSSVEFAGRQAVVSGAIDITDQRTVAEQMRLGREREQLAFESAGISTWEWDIRENHVIWSPEVRRIFGISESEALANDFDSLISRVHESDRNRVKLAIEIAVSSHQDFDIEFRVQRGDGNWGWVHSRATVFKDSKGVPERMIGVAIDVTSSKTFEKALRESEYRFRATFNQAAVGMALIAVDGSMLMVNHKLTDILGFSREELFGRNFREFTHPDDLPSYDEKFYGMLEGMWPSYTAEKRYIRKDGTQAWVQTAASLLRDENGRPKYIIKVIEDITERRQAAEALRHSEKLAATGRLAASIAHEINNPLEAVTNLLYLLEQNKSLDETAKGYTRMAQEEVTRVAHIARQTLGFYRDSTNVEPVQVSKLMDEVLAIFGRKIRNADIQIECDLGKDAPIEAYSGEVRQILSNLLANAIDATGRRGKIHVRVSRARHWTGKGQRGVRVSIGDSGPGIKAEHKARLFEPFFTTKGSKGTGLGLWVTMGMIQKHGGSIRVWSSTRPGNSGTVFTVFLPQKQKTEVVRKKRAI